MASLSKDGKGWRILFVCQTTGKRHTVRTGRCARKNAETARNMVEKLIEARRLGTATDRQTAEWLKAIDDKLPTNNIGDQTLVSARVVAAQTALSAGVVAVQTDTSATFSAVTGGFANVSADLVAAYTDMSAGWVNISADMVAMQTALSADIAALEVGPATDIQGVVAYDPKNYDVYANASLTSAGAVITAGAWKARLLDYDGTQVIGSANWTSSGIVTADKVAYWRYNSASDVTSIVASSTSPRRRRWSM